MLRWLSVAALGKPVVPAKMVTVPRVWIQQQQRASLLAAFACVAGSTGHSLASRGCISKQPPVQQSNAAPYAYHTIHRPTTPLTAGELDVGRLAGPQPGLPAQQLSCQAPSLAHPPQVVPVQPACTKASSINLLMVLNNCCSPGQQASALLHTALAVAVQASGQSMPDVECDAMRTAHLPVHLAPAPRHAAAVAARACKGVGAACSLRLHCTAYVELAALASWLPRFVAASRQAGGR